MRDDLSFTLEEAQQQGFFLNEDGQKDKEEGRAFTAEEAAAEVERLKPAPYVPSEERITPQDREPLSPDFLSAAKKQVGKGIDLAGQMSGLFEPEQTAAEEFVKIVDEDEQRFGLLTREDLIADKDYVARVRRYRKDRFGVEEDAPAANIMFGYIQESTDENIVDDYIDHYRFMTLNTMDATDEVNYLNDLRAREEKAAAAGDIKEANRLAEIRENAALVYQQTSRLASLIDAERYEGKNLMESMGEIGEAVGVNMLAVMSDPLTIPSGIVGRLVGGTAVKAGTNRILSAAYGFGAGAAVDGTGAAYLDGLIQQSEIEMGIRTNIDYDRMATVAGISAATSGVISGGGTYITSSPKRANIATRDDLNKKFVANVKKQEKLAAETNKRLKATTQDLRERLAQSIEKNYGKDAIKRNKDGLAVGVNEPAFKKYAKEVIKEEGIDTELFANRLSNSTTERVFAAIADTIDGMKTGRIKTILKEDSPFTVKELTGKLQPMETVSERIANILTNVDVRSAKEIHKILGKYGVGKREMGAALLSEASEAGRILAFRSSTARSLGRLNTTKTATEKFEDEADVALQKFRQKRIEKGKDPDKVGPFRRAENIRRLALVSAIPTAVANTFSGVIRSGVELPVYALESALNPSKKFSLRGTLSQLKYTFKDQEQAAEIATYLLQHFPEQRLRFYNQYTESMNGVSNTNVGQSALGRFKDAMQGDLKKAVAGVGPLDVVESLFHVANYSNRLQEYLFRNGMFTASMQRQFIDRGMDFMKALRTGKVYEFMDEDMIAKATNDALEFTYAAPPELALFRRANEFIVNTFLTLGLPFPRFMFKAMEMTYNYNYTGMVHGAMGIVYKGGKKLITGKDTGVDREVQRFAQGAAGGIPLISLGYHLRDPNGQSAGSEWYMLKDSKGREFDARYYFPLTPYLLIGEMMHRTEDAYFGPKEIEGMKVPRIDYGINLKELMKIMDGEKGAAALFEMDTWRLSGAYDRPKPPISKQVQEMLEGFTGTNFRANAPVAGFLKDLIAGFDAAADDTTAQKKIARFAEYIGEAASGYGQPFFQFADLPIDITEEGIGFADAYQRRKDFRTNPEYMDGLDAFWKGLTKPFKKRFDRVAERFDSDDETLPDFEDPRFSDVPERVLPFMKLFFGARFTRIPPEYVAELGRYGFSYTDYMAKTNNELLNRQLDHAMGESMQQNMPILLAGAKREAADMGLTDPESIQKYVAAEARKWLTLEKAALKAEIKVQDVDSAVSAEINRFRYMPHYNKQFALRMWEKENPGETLDMENIDHIQRLFELGNATPVSKRFSKTRKITRGAKIAQ